MAWRRLINKPMGLVAISVVGGYFVVAILAPFLPISDPSSMTKGADLHPPTMQWLLGTDLFGRDILSRVVFGTRVSLIVAISAAGLGALVGVSTGLAAGFGSGWVASVVLRFYDALLAFPTILLAIGIAATIGPSAFNAALALAIVATPQFARLARAGVLVERNKDYVIAATALGAGTLRVAFRHILPNIVSPAMVQFTLFMANAVLVESALSFLGLGVQPPQPSLGSMLSEGRPYIREAFWYVAAPGVVLTLLIFSLNTLSDAVRDVMDPRLLR
jgi:peptide/nickel transport system permease protein